MGPFQLLLLVVAGLGFIADSSEVPRRQAIGRQEEGWWRGLLTRCRLAAGGRWL